ncbi:hypothetical protein ACVJGD_005533 [Bradyrhizobium sp. USDA 10063]
MAVTQLRTNPDFSAAQPGLMKAAHAYDEENGALKVGQVKVSDGGEMVECSVRKPAARNAASKAEGGG